MSDLTLVKAICQVRYPANARFVDIRGKIASRWHEADGELSQWRLNSNAVQISNKQNSRAFAIDVRSLSSVMEFPPNQEVFVTESLPFLLHTLQWLEVRKIERIGLRFVFYAKRENIVQLTNRLRTRLFKLTDEEWDMLGGRPTDIAFVTIHKYQDASIQIRLGPMERSQLAETFESEIKDRELPEVSLFVDGDLFEQEPSFKLNSLDRYLKRFMEEGGNYIVETINRFVEHYEGFK